MKNLKINLGFPALVHVYFLKRKYLLCVGVMALFALPTHAFDVYVAPPPVVLDTPMMMFHNNMVISNSLIMAPYTKKKSGTKNSKSQATAFSTIAPGKGKAESTALALANRLPEAQRAKAELAFQESFVTYQQLEKNLGIPKNDMAGALSAFLVGNYEAYHNTQIAESHIKQLVEQMRNVLSTNPALKTATSNQKREFYEQMAIVGTFMVLAQAEIKNGKQPPNVAKNFRDAAKANLEEFLKVSVDKIELGAGGLKVR